jgi:hypothetical protein
MATFKVTKEMTVTKIKNAIKANLLDDFEQFLIQKYGENAVGMVRYGSTPKNELAFIVGSVDDDGFEHDVVATVNPTVKDWKEKKTKSRTTDAFDFEQYKADYDDYLTDKATKQAESKAKKNVKSAKEQEKAERKAELEQAIQRADEKSRAKTAEAIAKAIIRTDNK